MAGSMMWHKTRREVAGGLILLGLTINLLVVLGLIAGITDPKPLNLPLAGLYVFCFLCYTAAVVLAILVRKANDPARSLTLVWLSVGGFVLGTAAWLGIGTLLTA
jgi:hypothetical protein